MATCCPVGYFYVDSSGYFQNPPAAPIKISNPDVATYVNKCVAIVNMTWAILPDPAVSTVDCLCCPNSYVYNSSKGICVSVINPVGGIVTTTDPVPCIKCVCPPPEIFSCPTCGPQGNAVVFTFDFTKKQCVDCTILDNNGPAELNVFLPPQYIDPNLINFRLKNKNYI